MDGLDSWDLNVEDFDSLEKDALDQIHQHKKQKRERCSSYDASRNSHMRGLPTYLLIESAVGYAILLPHGIKDVENHYEAVQDYINRFTEVVDFIAFSPFKSEDDALKQFNAISKGNLTQELENFLKVNLPKPVTIGGRGHTYVLGVDNPTLACQITNKLKISCEVSLFYREVFHGVRLHISGFVKDLELKDLKKAQVALAKKFSVQTLSRSTRRADS